MPNIIATSNPDIVAMMIEDKALIAQQRYPRKMQCLDDIGNAFDLVVVAGNRIDAIRGMQLT